MGDGKTQKAPPQAPRKPAGGSAGSPPATPAKTYQQRQAFLAGDCQTAMLFPDSAPLTSQAVKGNSALRVSGKRRTNNPGPVTTLDLQAVWTHVHIPKDAKATDDFGVLILLHGHYTFVTIDEQGKAVWPSWAADGFGAATREGQDPEYQGSSPGAPVGYKYVQTARAYSRPIIAIAPEVVLPYQSISLVDDPARPGKKKRVYSWGIPGIGVVEQAGELKDKLGPLIEDCKKLLSSPTLAQGSACKSAPLSSVPKTRRLFIAGHSGGGVPLDAAARADVALNTATDLILLDSTYGYPAGAEAFCKHWKDRLGNGTGKSRLIDVWISGTDTQGYSESLRDVLTTMPVKKGGLGLAYRELSPDKDYDAKGKQWKAPADTQVVQINHKTDSKYTPSASNLEPIRMAMIQFPIVFIKTGVSHFRIPEVFTSLALETAGKTMTGPKP